LRKKGEEVTIPSVKRGTFETLKLKENAIC